VKRLKGKVAAHQVELDLVASPLKGGESPLELPGKEGGVCRFCDSEGVGAK